MIKSFLGENSRTPSFHSSPFTWLFTFYSLGILIQESGFESKGILGFVLILGLFVFFIYALNRNNKERNPIPLFVIFILFFSLGHVQLAQIKNEFISDPPDAINLEKNTVLQINEIELKDSIHAKAIGSVLVKNDKNWELTSQKILLYIQGDKAKKLNQNDIILCIAKQQTISNSNNPGEFNASNYWKAKGVVNMCFLSDYDILPLQHNHANWLDQKLAQIRKSLSLILEKELDGSNLAIAQALILGDKSLLDQEIRTSFGATGAMHVLAVSGLHIGIIAQVLLFLFQFFSKLISRRNAVFFIVILLWIYALLTGFSPSVVRAVFMFSVLILAQEAGGNYSPINTLFFTAFILLLINPLVIYDIGFQLSYLAMLGIFSLYQSIAAWYTPKNKIMNYLWQGSAIGFAAQAMTIPLTLYYFYQFPNYFALTNLGIMGISTVAMGFGMGIFILHYIPIIGKIASLILSFSLWIMLHFLQWVEHLPGSVEYGFNIPFYLVPILMLFTYLIIATKRSIGLWKFSACIFIVLLGVVSYGRYKQQHTSHLIFFNNNQFVMAVKIKSQIVVIYDHKNDKKTKQIESLISNYSKCYPGKLTFIPLKKENVKVKFGSTVIDVKKENFGRSVLVNNQIYTIVYGKDFKENNLPSKKEIVLFMPWLQHAHSLAGGSKIYKL